MSTPKYFMLIWHCTPNDCRVIPCCFLTKSCRSNLIRWINDNHHLRWKSCRCTMDGPCVGMDSGKKRKLSVFLGTEPRVPGIPSHAFLTVTMKEPHSPVRTHLPKWTLCLNINLLETRVTTLVRLPARSPPHCTDQLENPAWHIYIGYRLLFSTYSIMHPTWHSI
jgi:hypothetical protein